MPAASSTDGDGDANGAGGVGDHAWLQEQLAAAAADMEGGMEGDDDDMLHAWQDPSGGTLTQLLQACEAGQVAPVQQLIAELPSPVTVDTPGPDGDTALHLAALYGRIECVQLLLESGADAGTVNQQDGSTVLHDAAAGGYLDICELVLARAQPDIVNTADEDGDQPLHNAARGNHLDVVRLLLAKGADPKARNQSGSTPAEEAEDSAVIELLGRAAR